MAITQKRLKTLSLESCENYAPTACCYVLAGVSLHCSMTQCIPALSREAEMVSMPADSEAPQLAMPLSH